MNLAIFDVDGTLTDTNQVDAVCFVRAVSQVVGVDLGDGTWTAFSAVTDSGIVQEIYQRHRQRPPTADEVASLRRRFIACLEEAAAQMPHAFAPIPGAPAALERLGREPDWAVAIATGCWQASALLKLRSARIPSDTLPAAFAEDGLAREDIVCTAIERAQQRYAAEGFARVVSIGDAPWDVSTARRLGLPFVGVRHDGQGERLRRLGASHVLADLVDVEVLLHSLAVAGVPAGESAR
jgi:phosphoglycolate phosphatase-like HAD superfamily hydrolase